MYFLIVTKYCCLKIPLPTVFSSEAHFDLELEVDNFLEIRINKSKVH